MKFSQLTGRVWRDGDFWLSEVVELDVMSQGVSPEDARVMIADAIVMLVEDSGFRVTVKDIDGEYFAVLTNNEEVLWGLHRIRFHGEGEVL